MRVLDGRKGFSLTRNRCSESGGKSDDLYELLLSQCMCAFVCVCCFGIQCPEERETFIFIDEVSFGSVICKYMIFFRFIGKLQRKLEFAFKTLSGIKHHCLFILLLSCQATVLCNLLVNTQHRFVVSVVEYRKARKQH